MIIAGVDYSYTSPAICVHNTDDEFKFEKLKFFNYFADSRKTKLRGVFGRGNIFIDNPFEHQCQEHRFSILCAWASEVLWQNGVEEVCIEGYSMGATAGLVFNIAENTSLLKQYMWSQKIPFTTPTPSQVKKNFTGKGNAKKDAMVAEFYRRFPDGKLHELIGIKEMAKPIDDIVDSCAVLLCHSHFKKEIK
jgi:Holliday junction resolvasome RuvABC endonuclease subunit